MAALFEVIDATTRIFAIFPRAGEDAGGQKNIVDTSESLS
jgi:hypothetical protein